MKRFLMLAAAAILAGLAGMWLGQRFHPAASPQQPLTAVSQPVNFSLPDIHGKKRSIADWNGKVRIVNFWATWCPPCREEIPEFIKAQRQFGPRGLQIIGVAVDRTSRVIPFYKARGMNYPVLLGEQEGAQLMEQYGDAEGGLPYSLVLDRQGRIVASQLGAFSESRLERVLRPYFPPSS